MARQRGESTDGASDRESILGSFIGVGLVATEEDFGSSGETPSHPELLDDLAWRFQNEMGLSTRVCWRESSCSHLSPIDSQSPDISDDDPYNRLLARDRVGA